MKLLLCLLALLTVLPLVGNDDLLLNVSFEGTLKADKANGSNVPVVKRMKQAEFTKGIRGNAVRMKKNGGIYYEAVNNINVKQGTIAFWMRPVDWEPGKRTKNYHWIFAANKSGANVDRLQFFKMPGPLVMLFIGKQGKIKQLPFSIGKWKKNQWHFVAFSWNSDRVKLFIDGRVVGKVKISKNGLPTDIGTKICLQAGKETTDYDDLQIYKRALTDGEIEALYIENAPASTVGSKKVDVTPATFIPRVDKAPVIDGRVAPGEWDRASAIGGFLIIPELELSKRKMQVKLCYDDDAMYFLVQSEIGKSKSSFSSGNNNVWSAPSAEILFQCGVGEKLPVNHFALNIFDRHFSQLKGNRKWNPAWQSKSIVNDRVWVAEVKIPFRSLEKSVPKIGAVWRFNFGRNFIAPRNFANPAVALAYADTKAFWNVKFTDSGKAVNIDYVIDSASKVMKMKPVVSSGITGKENVNLYIKKLPMSLIRIRKNLNNIATARGKVVSNITTDSKGFAEKGITAKLPGAGRYAALASIKDSGNKVIYRQLQQFIIRDSFSVALKFLSKSKKFFVEWELNSPVKPPFSINATLVDDTNSRIASVKQRIVKETFSGKIEFDMSKLKKLNYSVVVTLDSRKFKQTRKVPFKCYYNAPWIGFEKKIAEAHKVPAPWKPVVIEGGTAETLTLKYRFGKQGMPDAILADGKELLAQPIDLKFSVDSAHFTAGKMVWTSKYSDAATFSIPFSSKDATAQLTGTVEFDGMIRYDLKITPKKSNARLTGLVLDIPLQNSCSKLKYPYCGPYQKWNICDLEGKVNKYYADAFMPHIWVGNTRRGVAWFAESNKLYRPFGNRKVIELKQLGDKTLLRINIVTAPLLLSKPVTYTFGIQGTPMKPIASDWTSQVLASCISTKRNNIVTMGYTTGRDYHVMAGIPYPSKNAERARRWVKGVHRVKGRRALVYATSNGVGSKSPQYRFFEQEWKNPLSCDTWSLASRGEYHQGTCPTVESWRDFFLWSTYKALEDFDIDGLYYDFATVPSTYNEAAGCGFTYKGKQYPSWPIFTDRQMRKRIYQIVMDKKGHADFVFHNYSKSMAPIMSFATMLLDGEVYQQRTGVIGAKITDDYTKLIPLPRLQAMFGAQWGCTPYFLSKLAGNKDDYGTARLRKATRCMIGMMLPHGIPIWGFYCDIPELNKYTAVQDRFGIDDSKFFPCYNLKMDKLLSPAKDKILVGYWLKKDSALVAIGNLSSQKYSGMLNIAEILPGAVKAENAYGHKNYSLTDGKKISIEVPGKDYLLLVIQK